ILWAGVRKSWPKNNPVKPGNSWHADRTAGAACTGTAAGGHVVHTGHGGWRTKG
ncbi:hypothetical protein TIFTF001_056209, partial [Ficus carica]